MNNRTLEYVPDEHHHSSYAGDAGAAAAMYSREYHKLRSAIKDILAKHEAHLRTRDSRCRTLPPWAVNMIEEAIK